MILQDTTALAFQETRVWVGECVCICARVFYPSIRGAPIKPYMLDWNCFYIIGKKKNSAECILEWHANGTAIGPLLRPL